MTELETETAPEAIFCLVMGITPKYFELGIQAIKFLKRSMKKAVVGLIVPPGVGDVRSAILSRLNEMEPKLDKSNIRLIEGQKHFEDWNNSQYILDIESYARDFDPVIIVEPDIVVLQDLLPFVDDFKSSGRKFGFLANKVNAYPEFWKDWEGEQKFIPDSSFMIFRSQFVPQLLKIWESIWKEWIVPAPFVNHKDPARYCKLSDQRIDSYALGQSIFMFVKNFEQEILIFNRTQLKICRNTGVTEQETKKKFLSAGSSYSNDGQKLITIVVQNGNLREKQDCFVAVKVGDDEKDTKAVRNTKDPVWDEELTFDSPNYGDAANVVLTLFKADDRREIGSAKVSLLDRKTHNAGEELALLSLAVVDTQNTEKAKLNLGVRFFVEQLQVPSEEEEQVISVDGVDSDGLSEPDQAGAAAGGSKNIIVTIVGAKILKHHGFNGFVKMKFGSNEKQTKVIENQDPQWNEVLVFEKLNDESLRNVEVSIWNGNECIGTAVIVVDGFMRKGTGTEKEVVVSLRDDAKVEQAILKLKTQSVTSEQAQKAKEGKE